MKEIYDVVVVGSSLAGTTLAIRLARRGISVALVDKCEFPRAKACGEGLSASGLRVLRELEIEPPPDSTPHSSLVGYELLWKSSSVKIPFVGQNAHDILGIGINRRDLDGLLVRAAENESHIKLFHSERVREVQHHNSSVTVGLADRQLVARYLVLADGANSQLAPRLRVPQLNNKRARYGLTFSIAGEFLNNESAARTSFVRIFVHKHFQVFCTPTSPNRLNVSMLADKAVAAHFTDINFLRNTLATTMLSLAFQGEVTGEPLASGPLGWQRRSSYFGNIMLVGDSCEQLDPIGGMGMTHALQSASLGADALATVIVDKVPQAVAFAHYRQQREQCVRPLRGFTRLSYFSLVAMSNHRMANLLTRSYAAKAIGNAVHDAGFGHSSRHFLSRSLLATSGYARYSR